MSTLSQTRQWERARMLPAEQRNRQAVPLTSPGLSATAQARKRGRSTPRWNLVRLPAGIFWRPGCPARSVDLYRGGVWMRFQTGEASMLES
jgi:hypothetical protein